MNKVFYRKAILVIGIFFLCLFLLSPGAMADDDDDDSDEKFSKQLVIHHVSVDFEDEPKTITIEGESFIRKKKGEYLDPEVSLGGVPLTVYSAQENAIVVHLPDDFSDGGYLLEVSTGEASKYNDVFNLTIGAAGPEGPINTEPLSYAAKSIYGVPHGSEYRYYFGEAEEINNTQGIITTFRPSNYSHMKVFMFNRPGLYSVSIRGGVSSWGGTGDSILVLVGGLENAEICNGELFFEYKGGHALFEYDKSERRDFHFKMKEFRSYYQERPGDCDEISGAVTFEMIAMNGQEVARVNTWEAILHIEYRGPIRP